MEMVLSNIILQVSTDLTPFVKNLSIYIGVILGLVTTLILIFRLGLFVQKHLGRIKNLEADTEGNIKPAINKIIEKIDNVIIPGINDIKVDVSNIKGRMDRSSLAAITEVSSPMRLNKIGKKILTDSKINIIIDEYYDDILKKVRSKDTSNAYRVQEAVVEAVKSLYDIEHLNGKIEVGAYEAGYGVELVLLVGALFIRDRILKELNLLPDDIEKHDPDTK